MKLDSDGVFTRSAMFGGPIGEDVLCPELRALVDEFEGSDILVRTLAKIAFEMQDYGLDPTTPDGQKQAAQVARLRLTRPGATWFDSTPETLAREAAIENTDGNQCVYYLDLYGSCIKIGYSAHLLNRLAQLRRDRTHLLAVEPGGYATEKWRHSQFGEERHSSGREDFERSDRLLAHIARLVVEYGEPLDYLARVGAA